MRAPARVRARVDPPLREEPDREELERAGVERERLLELARLLLVRDRDALVERVERRRAVVR